MTDDDAQKSQAVHTHSQYIKEVSVGLVGKGKVACPHPQNTPLDKALNAKCTLN